MLKFFQWIFGVKREKDNSQVVENIKTTSENRRPHEDTRNKQKKNKNARYFFVLTRDVKKKNEMNGIITGIELASGAAFEEIVVNGKVVQTEQKKGLSKVYIDIELPYDNSSGLFVKLSVAKHNNESFSILCIDEYDNCSLLGEHNGLKLAQINESQMRFTGEESDVFYRVDTPSVRKMLKINE